MRKVLTSLLLVSLMAACTNDTQPSTPPEDVDTPSVTVTDTGIVDTSSMSDIGIGDIESHMNLSVVLHDTSYSPSIVHSEEETKRNRVAKASAEVSAPYPEKLHVLIFNVSAENFPGHAYRATVSLYVGKEIVHTFAYITGKNAKTNIKAEIVDIMPYLNATPGSTAEVHARAKIEFFPGTDETTLTLDTPAPDTIMTATKLSNPFRVTFK